MSYSMVPLSERDLIDLKAFTDREIGKDYYSMDEVREIFRKSHARAPSGLKMCSFLLKEGERVLGVRITYAPGNWNHGKGPGLTADSWPFTLNETAYFQSLFLASEIQGQGWGTQLSDKSVEVLREIGAKGIVCHSWKESPGGSSTKYLEKMGFQPIKEHPLYWQHLNYNCTRCLKPPCQCTAVEMYYRIPGKRPEKNGEE